MFVIRPLRMEELPLVIARGADTARAQLVERDLPGATHGGVGAQLATMYQRALAVPDTIVLAADWPPGVAGDGPAAHALLMPQPNPFTGERELVVLDIYTHPTLRGRGLGRALLDAAAAYGRRLGCGGMTAQVALHNQHSLNLFQAGGFKRERVVVGKRL